MEYELITGNTGAVVTPAKDGNFYKALVGEKVVCMGQGGDTEAKGLQLLSSRDNGGNFVYKAHIFPGTYLYNGRQIIIYSELVFDITSVEDGALVGFMYNRTKGIETIEAVIKSANTTILNDIDLQDAGMIVFGVIGLNEASPYIKENNVRFTKTLETLSNPVVYSDHQTNIAIAVGRTELLSVPEGMVKPGRYLAILSLQLKEAPKNEATTIKLRFEKDSANDYNVSSKETNLQVLGIHEFTPDSFTDFSVEAYLWHPSEALQIADLKFQLFQLN